MAPFRAPPTAPSAGQAVEQQAPFLPAGAHATWGRRFGRPLPVNHETYYRKTRGSCFLVPTGVESLDLHESSHTDAFSASPVISHAWKEPSVPP